MSTTTVTASSTTAVASASTSTAEASAEAGVGLVTFVTALAVSLIIFGVQILGFVLLKNKLARIYKPKCYLVPERQRTTYPPTTPFGWLFSIFKFRDREIIRKCGLDAYFFLRYLQTLLIIFVPLGVLLLPILLPINYIDGIGQNVAASASSTSNNSTTVIGLSTLSWSNIKPENSKRYWAHLVLAIVVVIWVCMVFTVELRVYVRIRQTYLTSAEHRLRASATTILVSSIPAKWLSYEALHGLYDVFPGGIRNIWINRDFSVLLDKVKLRDTIYIQLEKAETELIRAAKKAQLKQAGKDAKAMAKKAGAKAETKQDKAIRDKKADDDAQKLAQGHGVSSGDPHETQHTVSEVVDGSHEPKHERQTSKPWNPLAIVGSGIEKGLDAVGNGFGTAAQTVVDGGKHIGEDLDRRIDNFETTRGFVHIDGERNADADRYKAGYNEKHDLHRYQRAREAEEKKGETKSPMPSPATPASHKPQHSVTGSVDATAYRAGGFGFGADTGHKSKPWWMFWLPPAGSMSSPIPAGHSDEVPLTGSDEKSTTIVSKIAALVGHTEPVETDYPLAHNPDYKLDDETGAVWEKYLKAEDRPTHRIARFEWTPDWLPGIPLVSPKVDTIYWCREQLARLNVEIEIDQQEPERFPLMNSAFIQFNHQVAAHMAAQCVSHHIPKNMAPRSVEISPSAVIWDNMSIKWLEEWIRKSGIYALVAGMVILWAFPVAWTATLSQLWSLGGQYSWLSWIQSIPKELVDAVAGVLPALVLALLLWLVPKIFYLLAGYGGAKTQTDRDLEVQNYYFSFLFVQVFLVVSIAGGAISALQSTLNDVTSIPNTLAHSLPTAANYFFSYMILQALSTSSGTLLQIKTLVLYIILPKISDDTARDKWKRSTKLPNVRWGSFFPVYTNFACIALVYSIIAPLVIVFAVITFTLLWIANRYNMLYVTRFTNDTGGLLYPRAINHSFVGLYVMELCMVGLFFLVRDEHGNAACTTQAIIMIVVLLLTLLFQYLLNDSFSPLLKHLPITLEDEAVLRDEAFARAQRIRLGIEEPDIEEMGDSHGPLSKSGGIELQEMSTEPKENGTRFDPRRALVTGGNWAARGGKLVADKTLGKVIGTDAPGASSRKEMEAQRRLADALYGGMADEIEDLTPEERDVLLQKAFLHQAVRSRRPTVWIPRDDLGISDDEIRRTREYSEFIWISNDGTALDSKCRVVYGRNPPDFSEVELIEL